MRKVFTPVGITFKGNGFYKTDNRGKSSSSSSSQLHVVGVVHVDVDVEHVVGLVGLVTSSSTPATDRQRLRRHDAAPVGAATPTRHGSHSHTH